MSNIDKWSELRESYREQSEPALLDRELALRWQVLLAHQREDRLRTQWCALLEERTQVEHDRQLLESELSVVRSVYDEHLTERLRQEEEQAG